MDFKNFLKRSDLDHKEYQEVGVDWCTEREKDDVYCRGGIIADEMGLGKTIMMIGTIIKNFSAPNLIVLPVVLLKQWKDQLYRTTGHKCLIYHGSVTSMIKTSQELQHYPIVLTTYGTLLSDSKKEKKITGVKWKRILYDEAHHMKNRKAKISDVARNMRSDVTWLITGTPIQNNINDLYSLFEILNIDRKYYLKTENLKNLFDCIILKRTKKEVGINLPDLNITRIESKWDNEAEKKLTEEVHNNINSTKEMRLAMMLYARMMCVLPSAVSTGIKKIQKNGMIADGNYNGVNGHSKMDTVINKIVERKDNGNRKIIFSNFHDEIDYLKQRLTREDMIVESMDGRVKKNEREVMLNQELDVLIIQIKTGCEGLNLQQYNEIYFVTPDWNPQTEEQAIARCHRIGQEKKVEVFRFVMGSFDEAGEGSNIELYSEGVQAYKRDIEKGVRDI
jgi:SNF2 family DNA or RNA helicase